MVSLKVNATELNSVISSNLKNNEKIIFNTQVLVLDKTISNYLSCQLYASQSKLFIFYDDNLMIYDIYGLTLLSNNIAPNFDIQSILIEGKYNFMTDTENVLTKVKDDYGLFKFVINDNSSTPIQVVARKDFGISRNYQQWALFTILKSIQESGQFNPILIEILDNKFMEYNSKLLLTVMWIGITFVIVRIALMFVTLGYIESLIDLVFIILMLMQGIKVIKMYRNRLIQYKRVYMSYN